MDGIVEQKRTDTFSKVKWEPCSEILNEYTYTIYDTEMYYHICNILNICRVHYRSEVSNSRMDLQYGIVHFEYHLYTNVNLDAYLVKWDDIYVKRLLIEKI